jgi:molecular chaperone GrpE
MDKQDKKRGPKNGDELLEEILKAKKSRKIAGNEIEKEIIELKSEIDLLRKELAHYKKVEEDYLDKLKRLHADYDNYRKRVLREQMETISRANRELIEKLLPVIDSFEQALVIGKNLKGEEDDFFKGTMLIYKKLMDVLAKEGITVIDPHGQEFNPHECEVVITEDSEEFEEGTVLEVLRKGYKLNDFLIRPAAVKVCKKN